VKRDKIEKSIAKSTKFRIGLAQLNAVVGDITGNLGRVLSFCKQAEKNQVDLVLFPELCLTGYPPEDLLLKASFVRDNLEALKTLCKKLAQTKLVAVVGFVDFNKDNFNAAAVIQNGRLKTVYYKRYLPNYGVFDEDRYFQRGEKPLVLEWGDMRIGLSICEDLWYAEGADFGDVDIILNLSSSPYHFQKGKFRERMFGTRASDNQAVVAFCNMVGGQDELVFDGGSMIFSPRGDCIGRAKYFEEDFLIADLDLEQVFSYRIHEPRIRKIPEQESAEKNAERVKLDASSLKRSGGNKLVKLRTEPRLDGPEEVFRALSLGTRDYVLKNGFKKVLIGLSGGIDSSLVAAIAVDALGKDSVVGLTMPSRYTSKGTKSDAHLLAKNLGIKVLELPIEKNYGAYLETLAPVFKGFKPDVTEENIQARIRGNLLMALSNKFGWLVLTTGNKSEIATGYCTLYGDMAGGFAVIKDVPKTLVYKISEYYNKLCGKKIIPQSVLDRPPSAELRPDQKDQDTLPPYELLDPIIQGYIVEDLGFQELVRKGFPAETVRRVIRMIDLNEYKRRQAPPGVKITPRAFGRDWRLPITNHYNIKK
jgi:NAD+ synthase (glutamine-hydrolysing)